MHFLSPTKTSTNPHIIPFFSGSDIQNLTPPDRTGRQFVLRSTSFKGINPSKKSDSPKYYLFSYFIQPLIENLNPLT
ncbi:hypothetical protein EF405_04005 [Cyclobacteriaceae bacterium YHN15]|nr:hypothetical protein EF405_04005 [Cyclobacteriaceae bacterium YHN15]